MQRVTLERTLATTRLNVALYCSVTATVQAFIDWDGRRIRDERVLLTEQVKQLQAINQQQAEELTHNKFTIDVYMERIADLKQAFQSASSVQPAPATASGAHLPTHQEMGGHARLPTASPPFPSSMATPDSRSTPSVLTPVKGLTPQPPTHYR